MNDLLSLRTFIRDIKIRRAMIQNALTPPDLVYLPMQGNM
jgi:hypothetical protein